LLLWKHIRIKIKNFLVRKHLTYVLSLSRPWTHVSFPFYECHVDKIEIFCRLRVGLVWDFVVEVVCNCSCISHEKFDFCVQNCLLFL
jgi:hypothetical protein